MPYLDFNPQYFVSVPDVPTYVSYNCECDDDYPRKTLAEMRKYLMIRLGFAAQLAFPPPGMNDLLNSFLVDAQEQLFREYKVFRMERYFSWNMQAGVRFYDFLENRDECTKKMDPRMVNWVGISSNTQDGDGNDTGGSFWHHLVCGIPAEFYRNDTTGWPSHYEIRQCIEVWPAPSDDTRTLRIKGYFGLSPLVSDNDVSSIDYEPLQLFALANAKAHYGQPDAANYQRQWQRFVGNVVSGTYHTARFVPGTDEYVAPPLPIFTGYTGN